MTPEDIELLLHRDSNEAPGGTGKEAMQRRSQLLKEALKGIQQQWHSAQSGVEELAEKLADASRDEKWRFPLGDSGILEFFLGVIGIPDISQGLKIQTLRLTGNSCADTDENRAIVVYGNHIPTIMGHLSDPDMRKFAVPVLYNIMLDYEPAQLQGCNAGLSIQLINLISGPKFAICGTMMNIICKILSLMIAQEPEPSLALAQAPLVLLTLAMHPHVAADVDNFVAAVSAGLAYLGHLNFQTEFIGSGGMPTFLSIFATAQTAFDPAEVDDPDLIVQLKQLRKSLFNSIADLTGLSEFTRSCNIGSPVFETLRGWLMGQNPNLQSAAALALGNLCRSDKTSLLFVKTYQIHEPLIALVSSLQADTQLLHSALSFLKNLAIPTMNKPILGKAGLFAPDMLPRIWSLDMNVQVQFAAVSLARLLLVGCSPNVKRLCSPLSPDPGSPAHQLTNLSHLIDLFSRADAEPTKMEAARAVSAVCRVLHSIHVASVFPESDPRDESYIFNPMERSGSPTPTPEPAPAPAPSSSMPESTCSSRTLPSYGTTARETFYDHHENIIKPLAHLLTQQKFPVLRSETWFILALMARSDDGARIVMRVFQIHEALSALLETVVGQKLADHDLDGPPSQQSQIEKQEQEQEQQEDQGGGLGHDLLPADLALDLGLAPQQVTDTQAQTSSSDMARIDRENCLVMVAELSRRKRDELPPLRRHYFEKLLREGGQIVVEEREGVEGGQDKKDAASALMESWPTGMIAEE